MIVGYLWIWPQHGSRRTLRAGSFSDCRAAVEGYVRKRFEQTSEQSSVPRMVFADLIFPIFTFPYFMVVAPWAISSALGAEMIVFSLSNRQLGAWKIVAGTLGANALSWFIGILASCYILGVFLPGFGMRSDPITEVHYLWWGLLTAFFVAFLLSTILEYFVWRGLVRWWPASPTLASVAVANAISYLVLLIFYFFMNHCSFES